MKKLIASLLTVATVASMASMSMFAADAGTKATFDYTIALTPDSTDDTKAATIALEDTDASSTTIASVTGAALAVGGLPTVNDIAATFAGKSISLNGVTYKITVAGAKLTFTATAVGKVGANDPDTITITGLNDASVADAAITITDGTDATGYFTGKVAIEDAILCDGKAPIALVEDGDSNDSDGVKTGKSVYFMVQAPYDNDDNFKVDVKKADGSKNISKISIVDKNFSKDLVIAGTKIAKTGTSGRKTFVKVELKELYTDSESKINFDMTIKCKKAVTLDNGNTFVSGDSVKLENIGQFYMKNSKDETDDVTYSAGTKGVVVKPIKNEENTVEWEDNNDTIAKLTFEADSDVNAYYPKLSTKWDNAQYAENFAGTDAFIRNFVGNPTISATSRPVLEFYNPFVDEDDEETVAPEDVVIYQVVDGALEDVTDKFTIGDNDDGDSVFTIKTRTLGTYIFSNGAAVAPEEAPAEEAPSDVKENPGTGRF